MHNIQPMARYRRLQPGRASDLILRACGLLLLAMPVALTRWLYGLRHHLPPHPVGPWEFLIAFFAIAALWLAAFLLLAGDDLLRAMPRPPRPLR